MIEDFIGKKIKNKYLIQEKLGQGGMGVIFKALLLPIEREVALKIFLPQPGLFSSAQEYELRTRFIAEGYIMAKMNYKNVVTLNDFDIDKDICYLVTDDAIEDLINEKVPEEIYRKLLDIKQQLYIGKEEFTDAVNQIVDSLRLSEFIDIVLKYTSKEIPFYTMEIMPDNLAKLISENSSLLTEDEILKISLQICDGLYYLHSKNVIHRDIKPENIIITSDNIVKVADFGISEIEGIDFSLYGDGFMSPEYCAPEQWEGQKVTLKADIFSVGVTIYKLLTGQNPKKSYKSVNKFNTELDPEWDNILLKALTIDPKDRYNTALDFKNALLTLDNPERKKHANMVKVPAGIFLFGKHKEEKYLSDFWIDRYPVTNKQYRKFIESVNYSEPAYLKDSKFNKNNQPVVGVSWEDAIAYAKWANKALPSIEEWEKAARGEKGSKYSWGDNMPDAELCNFGENIGKTTPVDFYEANKSIYGCFDMIGNVREWTSTSKDEDDDIKATKGGSWLCLSYQLEASQVEYISYDKKTNYLGFRCIIRD